jgi:hypothetical protein
VGGLIYHAIVVPSRDDDYRCCTAGALFGPPCVYV